MTLPDWLEPLYDASEMRAADAFAIERDGIPGLDLMERAGAGLAAVTARVAGPGPVRIVVGKGNNGGDGLVVARLLRGQGLTVDVLAAAGLDELQGDAAANLERLPGAPPAPFADGALEGSGVVVDALLGTGFSGAPREPVAGAIAAINAASAPVVACDVPSGVDASTAEIAGEAVRATATATFHAEKIGLRVAPGREHAGEVEVVEIGIPRGAPRAEGAGLIAPAVLGLVPQREAGSTKFSSGRVVVAGGAAGLTGAPTMVALAAQRAGAGYVQAAVPRPAEPALAQRLLEAMTRALPDQDGAHCEEGLDDLLELAGDRPGVAIVVGPGLGRSDSAAAFGRRAALETQAPLVLDADGLNAFAGELASLRSRPAAVLTPHEGELGRLLGRPSDEIAAHRLASAREAAAECGQIVVLKGDDSIVADPSGRVAVSPGGAAGLATAGTGDVLAGVLGALLAKGMDPFAAACAGVLAHVRAGRDAAARVGANHVIASDVIEALPSGLQAPLG